MAAVCAVLAFVSPDAGAQTEDDIPKPEVFNGDASALGISINVKNNLIPAVPDLFNFIGLDATGTYTSSNQAARASILFPGNGALIGPSLACGTFGGQFPPEFKRILDACLRYQYPLTVFADSFKPDGSTTGSLALGKAGDDISLNATSAKAHAAEDSATSDAVVQDLKVAGVPPIGAVSIPGSGPLKLDTTIAGIDSATSRTDQRIVKGELVSVGKATLSGVKLAGGLIRIGSIESTSRITDNADGDQSADATIDVAGVTVAGVPAKITNKGIVLAESTRPIDRAAQTAVKQLLGKLNVSLTTLPTEETANKGGAARAGVGGLLLELPLTAQDLPTLPSPLGELDPNGTYTLVVQIGSTGAAGSAANFGAEDELSEDLDDTLDEILDDDFTDGGFDDSDDDFADFDADDGTSSLGPGNPIGGNSAPQRLIRTLANNFGGRVGLLYLSLMLCVLALCIAPRLLVPARLPKNRGS